MAFAIWLRTAQRKEKNVQVADHRQEERMMDSNLIGNPALRQRNHRPSIMNDGVYSISHDADGRRRRGAASDPDAEP